MKTNRLIPLLVLFFASTASISADQAVVAPAPTVGTLAEAMADGAVNTALETLEDPSLSSPARTTDLQAILESTRTDSLAAIEIGFASRAQPERLRATLKLAGPIDQDADHTDLATLKGLADQTSVTFGFRRLGKTAEEIRKKVGEALQAEIDKGAQAFLDKVEEAWKAENPGKTRDNYSTDDLSARGRRRFFRELGATDGSFYFAGEATYAVPKTFSFAMPETLERRKEEHDAYSGTASVGWLPIVSPLPYIGLSFTYEDSFEGQGKQQVCEPFGPAGSLRCQSLSLGAPEKVERQLFQLEVRRFFPRATSAIGLRLTHDIKNDTTGVELPVWVVRDATGLLNGGVAAGWRSDTKEWTLSAFVGSPFGSKNER